VDCGYAQWQNHLKSPLSEPPDHLRIKQRLVHKILLRKWSVIYITFKGQPCGLDWFLVSYSGELKKGFATARPRNPPVLFRFVAPQNRDNPAFLLENAL